MRPGQNKRMRGRPNNNRRGPNPLTRSYESNGPDVKIRGNAHHVAEKYLQLARDAHTGGDPVAAENYLQHAEHYFRLIAAAQAAQALAQSGQQRTGGEGEIEDLEDDDDFGGPSDRFASPAERAGYQNQQNAFPAQPNVAPNAPQPYIERPPFEPDRQGQGDRGGFPNRQDRQDRQGNRFPDRGPRPDRPFGERTDNYRDNRQNRDGRPREFRPYRDSAPPPPREGAPEGAGPAALPSFITGGARTGPAEGDSPGPEIESVQTHVDAPAAETSINDGESEESRFPGRGRRRRLRSPYGFKAGQGDADIQNPSPIDDETPVSE
jgi:hypothetical protein